ncbi:MAG: class I SAM-dependent methyltransferase [Bdellovibrionota bacterium]
MWRNKYELYEEAVQSPEADVAFIVREYKKIRKKEPRSLREDFCGTGALLAKWVEGSARRSSVGVDLDPEPILYGLKTHSSALNSEEQKRVRFIHANVLEARLKADVICAFNYSYYIFKTRELLLAYFKAVHRSLNRQGLFFLDTFGGTEAMSESIEHRRIGSFTYYWECERFNPLTHECFYSIHFKRHTKGAKQQRRVFTYDWRFWTMPELMDLLEEAGFKKVRCYWEGDDRHGRGNGIFRETLKAENCESWISYIVAEI